MKLTGLRIRHSTVAAYLALFIALGGSAYAATVVTGASVKDGSLTGKDVRDRSITSRDVRDNSISTKDVKNATIGRGDLAPGTIPSPGTGPQGPQGPQGVPGPPGTNGTNGQDGQDGKNGLNGVNGQDGQDGTAKGYARVSPEGKDDKDKSINVTKSNMFTAMYCIDYTGAGTIFNVQATIDHDNSASADGAMVHVGPKPGCPNGTDAIVRTGGGGKWVEAGFYVVVN